MKLKILLSLLLGALIITTIFVVKQPSTTITIGAYEAKPHIDVTLDSLKISIESSPDDQIHVQMYGYRLNKDSVTIKEEANKFLIMEKESNNNWYKNFRIQSTPTIILQLPKAQVKSLTLNTLDGDCTIQDLTLDTVEVKTVAGFLQLNNISTSNANLLTQDGTVKVNKSTINNLSLTASAGDVTLQESRGANFTIQTTDGQIKIIEIVEQPNLHVTSEAGDIYIQYSLAPSSLQLITAGEDIDITLPKYDKKTSTIGDGVNILYAETKYGLVVIKK